MSKSFAVSLSEESILQLSERLTEYKDWVREKADMLSKKLAIVGIYEASVRFNGAYYDSDRGNDTDLSVEKLDGGYSIVAKGTQVCFIEFGAGVYYNGFEPHPKRPAEVLPIGGYGKHKGSQEAWGYYSSDGELHITHGTPATMPMYHASQKVEHELLSIAREVFSD